MARLTIGSNIDSLRAQRLLAQSSERSAQVAERLSSGQRLNRPSDDAASLSIASQLNSDARVLAQGIRNVNDGASLLNIAEGALRELSTITIRQKELAEQSANGSLGVKQRLALNAEAYQLTNEFNRIVESTNFNGLRPLDGSVTSIRIQAGFGIDGGVGFATAQELDRNIWNNDYSSTLDITHPLQEFGAVAGDINNDGRADLVTFVASNILRVSLGNSDGTFSTQTYFNMPSATGTITAKIADFNNDGKMDLLFVNETSSSSSTTYLSLGNGNGTFQNSSNITTASYSTGEYRYDAADVNGDGNLDLVEVSLTTASIYSSIKLGNGNGTFQAAQTRTFAGSGTAYSSSSLALGDINGDGKSDMILYATGSSNLTYVAYGNGSGNFSAATTYSLGVTSIAGTTDLNHDGYKDIVFSNGVMLGQSSGLGTFQSRTSVSGSTQLVDLNGDGEMDLTGFNANTLYYALGRGDGTFGSQITKNMLVGATSIAANQFADFNGDGVLDIVDYKVGSADVGRIAISNSRSISTIARFDILDQVQARAALTNLDAQLTRISNELGMLGSYRSRLETTLANLDNSVLVTKTASSRISDTDIAQESANYVREQILQNVGASILAQANLQPNIAITLLRSG